MNKLHKLDKKLLRLWDTIMSKGLGLDAYEKAALHDTIESGIRGMLWPSVEIPCPNVDEICKYIVITHPSLIPVLLNVVKQYHSSKLVDIEKLLPLK